MIAKVITELKLRIHIEGKLEKTVNIAQDEFLIGRLPECDLCLPFTEVSRHHCRLFKISSGEWLLEDLGSTNGTLLNQTRLKSVQTVYHGDVIQIGNIFLFIYLVSHAPADPLPDPSSGEVKTILRSAEELQQRWLDGDERKDPFSTEDITSVRLKYIVEIAKGLNSAESLEAIFSQVQEIVLREIRSIERLALLIDVEGVQNLELFKAAARNPSTTQLKTSPNSPLLPANAAAYELNDSSWISRTICQKAFTEKVAIKTIDARRDERFRDGNTILSKGVRGVLAVPLWDEKQVLGVLYADAHLGVTQLDQAIEDQDLSFFSTIANLVASSVQRWLLTRKLQEQEKIRQRLERYHSPAVVQQLVLHTQQLENRYLTPVEADISVLFADIVGFTALSERLRPDEIAELLNRFFEEMLHPLFSTGGTLDKFIGDCIMAFFGAPEPQPDHAERAIIAAKGMLERLQELNTARVWPHPLQLRIAINSGKAVVGDVGSSQRVDYTVLGATVNLAARLEEICPPGKCVISEATHRRLRFQDDFALMQEANFKGIDRPIRVYCAKWS